MRFAIGFIFVLASMGSSGLAQTECVAIENDIARLQCFDNAVAPPPEMSREEALARLNELSNGSLQHQNGSRVVFEVASDKCQMTITSFVRTQFYERINAFGVKMDRFEVNFRRIQEINDDYRDPHRLKITLDRGFAIKHRDVKWAIDPRETAGSDEEQVLSTFMLFLDTVSANAEIARRYNDFWVKNFSDRTMDVVIVREGEDRESAIMAFVPACHQT